MLNSEPNTPDAGTDNATPEQDDTAIDWYDGDPEEDTAAEPEDTATDDGTDETATEEPAEPEAEEPAGKVTLADGSQISLDEAVKGYMRQADYTRKTQEFAQQRTSLTTRASELDQTIQVFVDHLSKLMPKAPDAALALTEPAKYVAQKAQYDAARAQVDELIAIGQKPKAIAGTATQEDMQTKLAEENQRLNAMFPSAGTREGRVKFMEGAAKAAQDVGFTMQELQGIADHRLFALAHWAQRGMQAAQATKSVKEKVAAAPSPVKPGNSGTAVKNADAMKRLARSGSIHDAMKVDWG